MPNNKQFPFLVVTYDRIFFIFIFIEPLHSYQNYSKQNGNEKEVSIGGEGALEH